MGSQPSVARKKQQDDEPTTETTTPVKRPVRRDTVTVPLWRPDAAPTIRLLVVGPRSSGRTTLCWDVIAKRHRTLPYVRGLLLLHHTHCTVPILRNPVETHAFYNDDDFRDALLLPRPDRSFVLLDGPVAPTSRALQICSRLCRTNVDVFVTLHSAALSSTDFDFDTVAVIGTAACVAPLYDAAFGAVCDDSDVPLALDAAEEVVRTLTTYEPYQAALVTLKDENTATATLYHYRADAASQMK